MAVLHRLIFLPASFPPRPADCLKIDSLTSRTTLKIREAIRLIEQDGWRLVRTKGSHRQYKHSVKTGLVTISGKLGDDLAFSTLKSILKQAGLKP